MSRRLSIPFAILLLVVARSNYAQEAPVDLRRNEPARPAPAQVTASGVVTPTPEMWFYEQEQRRYDNPELAIRRRAETRGQERQQRLAAMRWYGKSNSRPTCSYTPWFGGYSDHWASNSFDPLSWRPMVPRVTVRPTNGPY